MYSDDWMLPFSEQVVNWTKCAVVIPESDYEKTGDILRAIPKSVQCDMQKCALAVWDNYVSSRSGWLNGLVGSALLSETS